MTDEENCFENTIARNRFRVKFDNLDLLTKQLTYFKYDVGYKEYIMEFRIPPDKYEKIIEDAASIKHFVLEVIDEDEIVFSKGFISNRIISSSTEFDYSSSAALTIRLRGNF